MIGQLRGKILEKTPYHLLLEVSGGIGYEVIVPSSTLKRLPNIGQEIILHTHFIVRKDAHILYGFHNANDRHLFRVLIKVNGIGPKLALTILSNMSVNELLRCVIDKNTQQLGNIPGISQKIAERLLIETKSVLKSWQSDAISSSITNASFTQIAQDAVGALIALGYKPKEAQRSIEAVQKSGSTREDLIRQALKYNSDNAK
ncbi:Holliday junction branch migration protein RuvA [Coxiella endosymbiont of Amblyomma americanum]|uniref:Holliday junction branch migration protein RuvA n=1 Tax=Coxiella endosymbiont of Amblyomma americanum TaxID=325775 RepID=UPI00057DF946|nr:Holliday junction branch migration protein RuvA [Coxiella-like endosymbiont of Amblyomma americanum]AJC50234.1 ATP-dependent DNA helicase RuvA [Coxiella endosymbiont of Amblyomma americanum]AUJ59011.1 Holliday junction branch migration protein RuvA [Coxiella-like endosymbiont of Amblyomma americanum]